MALTWRRIKGSNLTPQEVDGNTDEVQGLLTRLVQFIASQTPGANNITVLDASGIFRVGSYIVARPAVTNCGPILGDRSRYNTMVEASNFVYLCSNCYYDGTNWRSIAAGACYTLYIGTSGPKTATATATGAGEALSMTASSLMTVPANDTWSKATLLNGLTSDTTIYYRKQAATNNFQARGRIYNGTGSSLAAGTTICAIPGGYRPGAVTTLACAMHSGGAWTSVNNIRYDPSTGYIAFQSALPNGGYIDLAPLGWFVEA